MVSHGADPDTNMAEYGHEDRTYNRTQDVAFAWVLVSHPKVGEDSGLVLSDG